MEIEKQTNKHIFSRSNKEELFMYLSIFVCLIAIHFDYYFLAWFFGIKAMFEFIVSIYLAHEDKE